MSNAPRRALVSSLLLMLCLGGCAQSNSPSSSPSAVSGYAASQSAVQARIETLVIPTYPVGPATDFPDLGRTGQQRNRPGLYPYMPQTDLSFVRTDKSYQAYVLENEYLRLTVLPEIGGKLFSMYDKSSKQEVLYRQVSIKPGLVALRGAWISGGIEWDFPRSHSVTTFDTVSCEFVHHDDGSASIVIGDTERSFHTAWSVEMRLRPGVARLEAHIHWSNPTTDPRDGYWWTNACFPANDQTQIIFPFYKTTGDNGGLNDWPIRNGKDMSWYNQYPNGSSTFRGAGDEDFFAAYDHGKDLGLAQYADHRVMPGRKWFTWGNSEAGLTWAKTLSDDNRAYVEVQSGDPLTQGMHFHMQPHEQREYVEYWMPVSRIGTPSRINPDAAVSLAIADGVATIGVMPTHRIDQARILLTVGSTASVWQQDISPTNIFRATSSLNGADPNTVTLSVLDRNDQVIISHQYNHYAGGTPAAEPEARGGGNRPTSRPVTDADKLNDAVTDIWQGNFKVAGDILQALGESNPTDGGADGVHYYSGVVDAQLDQAPAALKQWDAIKAPGMLRDAAAIDGAKILMARSEWRKAVDRLTPLAVANQTEAAALTIVALRQMNEISEAMNQATLVLQHDPNNAMAQYELLKLQPPYIGVVKQVMGGPKLSLPPALRDEERRIELATAYMAVKQYATAAELLDDENSSATALYLRAYLAELANYPAQAKDLRQKAAAANVRGCLPARLEELAAFQSAIRADDNDASAHYLAGLVLYSRARRDESIDQISKAVALNPPDAIVYYCLGSLLREDKPADAIKPLERAESLSPKTPEVYFALDAAYGLLENIPKRIEVMEQGLAEMPGNDRLAHRLGIAYFDAGRYDDAVGCYQSHRFHVAEGQRDVHDYYSMSYVGNAMQHLKDGQNKLALVDLDAAEQYPENLGIGRPSTGGGSPVIEFWRGIALSNMGQSDEAKKAFQAAAPKNSRNERMNFYNQMSGLNAAHAILALRRLGDTDAADDISDQIERSLERFNRQDAPWMGGYVSLIHAIEASDSHPDEAKKLLDEAQSTPGQFTGYIRLARTWADLLAKPAATRSAN